MSEDMIDTQARYTALNYAVECFKGREGHTPEDILTTAYSFYQFLTAENLDEVE